MWNTWTHMCFICFSFDLFMCVRYAVCIQQPICVFCVENKENETKLWNASIYKCLCYTLFVNSIYLSNFEPTQTKPLFPSFHEARKQRNIGHLKILQLRTCVDLHQRFLFISSYFPLKLKMSQKNICRQLVLFYLLHFWQLKNENQA